jgi:hypothetical protein
MRGSSENMPAVTTNMWGNDSDGTTEAVSDKPD